MWGKPLREAECAPAADLAAESAVTARMAYLALGSNLGDKLANLRAARDRLTTQGGLKILAASRIYRTPPWGNTDQDWFANAALAVHTTLSPHAMLAACLGIENALGRVRQMRWGPRKIDIDVLAHGTTKLATADLVLPHPAMAERAFVLLPLQDVAPEFVLEGQPLAAHLARLDQTGIEPIAEF